MKLTLIQFINSLWWKGMLRSPLVLQTFAAHYMVVVGVTKLDDLDHPLKKPIGGLSLATTTISDIFP